MKSLREYIMESMQIVTESFACSYFKEIDKQLRSQGVQKRADRFTGPINFRTVMSKRTKDYDEGFDVEWDKVTDSMFKIYKADDNSRERKNVVKDIIDKRYWHGDAIVLLRDPETNEFQFALNPFGYFCSLTGDYDKLPKFDYSSPSIHGSSMTIKKHAFHNWGQSEYKNFPMKDRKVFTEGMDIYYLELTDDIKQKYLSKKELRAQFKKEAEDLIKNSEKEQYRKLGEIDLSKNNCQDFINKMVKKIDELEKDHAETFGGDLDGGYSLYLCLDRLRYIREKLLGDEYKQWIEDRNAEELGAWHTWAVENMDEYNNEKKLRLKGN